MQFLNNCYITGVTENVLLSMYSFEIAEYSKGDGQRVDFGLSVAPIFCYV